MIKRLIILTALLAWTLTANARLGDSVEQTITALGQPFLPVRELDSHSQAGYWKSRSLIIFIIYIDGKSAAETYVSKNDDFTQEKFQSLLPTMHSGTWKQMGCCTYISDDNNVFVVAGLPIDLGELGYFKHSIKVCNREYFRWNKPPPEVQDILDKLPH